MRSIWRWLVLAAVSSVAPALLACEDCYLRDMRTPSGIIAERATCWSSPEGVSEGCLPTEDGTNCQMWSYGNSCPEGSDDLGGGGPGGGGGGTGGGSGCSITASGSCPPECFSCNGGGGGFLY